MPDKVLVGVIEVAEELCVGGFSGVFGELEDVNVLEGVGALEGVSEEVKVFEGVGVFSELSDGVIVGESEGVNILEGV